jgi:hypothetical protein
MKYLIFYFDPHLDRMFVRKPDAGGKTIEALSGHNNFAAANDMLAQVVEADSPATAQALADRAYRFHFLAPFRPFQTSAGVRFEAASKKWFATCFGFVIADRSKGVEVASPFQLVHRRQKAYYYVHPANSGKLPDAGDIRSVIEKHHLKISLPDEEIRASLSHINPGSLHLTPLLVAQSPQETVNARPEYYELLVDMSRQKTRIDENGKIDFHQQSTVIQIATGTPLLRRHPEINPVEGTDLLGNAVPPLTETVTGPRPGENLVASVTDGNIFVANIDGCLVMEKDALSVKPVLTLPGDVDFNTGNIDFNGSVIVEGRVHPDFSIRAAGDIVVKQDIEDAKLEAGGNVTVIMGISGHGGSYVRAEGGIQAKFIMNSHVEARKKVVVEAEIMGSRVLSDDRVLVLGKPGKIIGGEVCALLSVETLSAGSHQETPTTLIAGKSIDMDREMAAARERFDAAKEPLDTVLNRITSSFGPSFLEDPKARIAEMGEERRKFCLTLLSELSEFQKNLAAVKQEIAEIEKRFAPKEAPFIVVREHFYPGSRIVIGKALLTVAKEIPGGRFRRSDETGEIVMDETGGKSDPH